MRVGGGWEKGGGRGEFCLAHSLAGKRKETCVAARARALFRSLVLIINSSQSLALTPSHPQKTHQCLTF